MKFLRSKIPQYKRELWVKNFDFDDQFDLALSDELIEWLKEFSPGATYSIILGRPHIVVPLQEVEVYQWDLISDAFAEIDIPDDSSMLFKLTWL